MHYPQNRRARWETTSIGEAWVNTTRSIDPFHAVENVVAADWEDADDRATERRVKLLVLPPPHHFLRELLVGELVQCCFEFFECHRRPFFAAFLASRFCFTSSMMHARHT